MNARRPWIFFEPNLEGATPAWGRVTEVDGEGNDEPVKFEEPRRRSVVDVGFVVSDMATRWRGGCFFAERFESVEKVIRRNVDVDLRDGMRGFGNGGESRINGGFDGDSIEGDAGDEGGPVVIPKVAWEVLFDGVDGERCAF